ncbi:hypothetical protein [Xanthomonas hortorum]|uniref:hypothetical protein n=1 Tax=Xanthomonas hortorum TaxID=56454 RepID=UPI002115A480|nr:hypothetical protein [Xanthomonas hortorum]UUF04782.1 hypothetical protein NDY25_22645 [Xanthomonas hortorum pv. pelargonii]
MNQTNPILAALAQAPDSALAAETCRIFIRSMLFNEGEHVEWESLDAVLALRCARSGWASWKTLIPTCSVPCLPMRRVAETAPMASDPHIKAIVKLMEACRYRHDLYTVFPTACLAWHWLLATRWTLPKARPAKPVTSKLSDATTRT